MPTACRRSIPTRPRWPAWPASSPARRRPRSGRSRRAPGWSGRANERSDSVRTVARPGAFVRQSPRYPLAGRLRRPVQIAMKARLSEAPAETDSRRLRRIDGTAGDEVRRHVGRRHRPHPQRRRATSSARSMPAIEVAVVVSAMAGTTNQLVAWTRDGLAAPRRARIRHGRRLRRAGDLGAARDRAAGHRRQCPLVAGLADPDPHRHRAWRGAHRRDRRRRADRAARAQGQVAVVAGFQGIGPDNRIATLGRGGSDTSAVAHRRRHQGRPLRHLHRRRRRLHHRSAHRAEGAAAVTRLLRGDAGDGLARRQGAAGALGRTGHGARGADLRALELRRPGCAAHRRTPTIRPERSSATRTKSWKRRSSPASPIPRTRRRSRSAASPTSRASPPAVFGPLAEANINVDMIVQNISEDGSHDRHDLHGADRRLRAVAARCSKAPRARSATRSSRARPTSPRCRSSASACAAMPASPPTRSRRLPRKGINIRAITTSEIKISVLIDAPYTELAVRTLHSLYGLDNRLDGVDRARAGRPRPIHRPSRFEG